MRMLAAGARLLLLLAAVLAASLWPPGVPRADLVLVVVAAAAIVHGPTAGLLTGLVGGWLVDLTPPGAWPLGAGGLLLAGIGGMLGAVRRGLVASPLLPWVATVVAAGAVLGLRWVLAAADIGAATPPDAWGSWVSTAVLAAALLPLLLALERRLVPPGRRVEASAPAEGRRR